MQYYDLLSRYANVKGKNLFFRAFFSGELHQVCFDEIVDLSIHHTVHVGSLVVRTLVFYATVIEYVTTDLRTPLDLLLSGLHTKTYWIERN